MIGSSSIHQVVYRENFEASIIKNVSCDGQEAQNRLDFFARRSKASNAKYRRVASRHNQSDGPEPKFCLGIWIFGYATNVSFILKG